MIIELRNIGPGHWQVVVGADVLGHQRAKMILDQMEVDFTASLLQNMQISRTPAEGNSGSDITDSYSEVLQAHHTAQKFLLILKQINILTASIINT